MWIDTHAFKYANIPRFMRALNDDNLRFSVSSTAARPMYARCPFEMTSKPEAAVVAHTTTPR